MEAVLDIHEGFVVLSVAVEDVDRESLCVEPPGSAHSMQVGVSIWREVEVYDQVDSLDVDPSAKEVGGHEKTIAVVLELVVALDSFLLLERRVDADRIEELKLQHFSQLFGPFHAVDEDDDLVEGQGVEQLYEFIELLLLRQAEVELLQALKDQFALIDLDNHRIYHMLPAVFLFGLVQGRTEHHHLLL